MQLISHLSPTRILEMVKHAEANVIGPIDYYPQMVG